MPTKTVPLDKMLNIPQESTAKVLVNPNVRVSIQPVENTKLRYDVAQVAQPVTDRDTYAFAMLVEQRAIRLLLTELRDNLRNVLNAIETYQKSK